MDTTMILGLVIVILFIFIGYIKYINGVLGTRVDMLEGELISLWELKDRFKKSAKYEKLQNWLLKSYIEWSEESIVNFKKERNKCLTQIRQLKASKDIIKLENKELKQLRKDDLIRIQELEDEVAPIRPSVKRGRKPKKI